jgi:hypothetical protein
VLFGVKKVRNTSAGLIWGSACVLAGVALNRTNVAVLAYGAPAGATYFPHWMEVLISVAAVAAGVLLFALAVRFLPILPEAAGTDDRSAAPQWSRRTVVFAGGALALLMITVVLLLQPATQAGAARTQVTTAPSTTISPREGECQTCHQAAQALISAGAGQDEVTLLTIEPLAADEVHANIQCVTCHYGDRNARDMEAAHSNIVTDATQGDAWVCVACHQELPEEFPQDRLRTPHDAVTHGELADVSCSDCHGAVGHGFDPVSGEIICPMGVCLECHQERNLDSELSDCDACHIIAHEPVPAFDCKVCHQSTDVWQVVAMSAHPMELAGGHAQAACLDCHSGTNFESVSTECSGCHKPPNLAHYGPVCQDCHTADGFQDARLPNHPIALEGLHKSAPCAACHADGQTKPESDTCSNCHERPANHLQGECSVCHTPEGWGQSIAFVVDLAPHISHDRDGRENCLTCHDLEGEIKPAPSNHGDYINEQCVLCHK